MNTLSDISQAALEVWLASGERSKERLADLVHHYACINGLISYAPGYTAEAIAAVKPWQWA